MQFKATLIDLERINQTIYGLRDIEKDRVIREGLRRGTRIFINAGKSNLRSRLKRKKKGTGNLLKSFRNKVKRNKLGALAGYNRLGMHSHLVDKGTKDRATRRGYKRGRMPANHFWTDAINSNSTTVVNGVYEGINRGITRILNRR